MSTEHESVPVSVVPQVGIPASGRRWLRWIAVALVAVVAAQIYAAFTVHLPYYEFLPGSARPTVEHIFVGDGVTTYETTGDIAFTTVSLQHSTIATYIAAWFNDDVEVVDERLVLGDRSPSENRQFNLQLMDTSKQDAIRVALIALGYDVPVRVDGNVVVDILPGSAADGKVDVGETIVAIDGEPLDELGDISRIMDGKPPGTVVQLDLEPPERTGVSTVELALGAAPDDPARGLIGVTLQPRNPSYEFPFTIDIDTGRVGGPSAGLAFTLAVLDVLTPGDLTGGYRVAVTGTIDANGNVGPVGGVRQKTAAVLEEGYDVFLVPSSELDEAVARAGDAAQVIPVDTLEDALDALASLGGSGLGIPVDVG